MKIKDPFDLSPDFIVRADISIPRWVNNWRQSRRSINFSGLCTEMMIQIIREHDPEYFEKHKKLVETQIRRKETTPTIKDTPLYADHF